MSFEEVVADLKNRYDDKSYKASTHLRLPDLQRWSDATGMDRNSLCVEIALFLARGFNTSKLTFQFCDAIANDLFGSIVPTEEGVPDLVWDVFLAFDAGEFSRDPNEDPVEAHTRPQIAKIIAASQIWTSMPVVFRPVEQADIPAMAAIRAREWGTEAYWMDRIGSYLSVTLAPQQALPTRAAFVAVDGTEIVGFVAGHLTHRFGCHGELQWINVAKESRGNGIADKLVAVIGHWFVEQGALRICVDVEPENLAAQAVYKRCGAQRLNDHWMVWEDAQAMTKVKLPRSSSEPA